jgi:hypothetical protein
MNRLILILFLALFASESFGQFWDKFKFWKEDTLAHQEGVFIFPLLYYTPDTRFAAGWLGFITSTQVI